MVDMVAVDVEVGSSMMPAMAERDIEPDDDEGQQERDEDDEADPPLVLFYEMIVQYAHRLR
jgi:hypothetical protein